jgi:threonine dehydrogenase-like Zn-dependent dehydrogenase
MDALILTGRREVRIDCVGEPPAPQPGEAVVAIRRVTLCGSDYALYEGSYRGPCAYPVRFGHEWAGTVTAAGPGTRAREGDAVTGDCSLWCGRCDACRVDRNLCRHIEKYGITRDGFAAERVTVPDRYLYVDRQGLPAEALALAEVHGVALHGIHRAGPMRGEPVDGPTLVIGGGPVGLATLLLLRRWYGWKQVELLEVAEERLALAQELFPGDVIPAHDDVAAAVRARDYGAIEHHARHPLVFETSGRPEGVAAALALAGLRGTVVLLAMAGGGLDLGHAVLKSLAVLGSIGGTGEFPEAFSFLAAHPEVARGLVTGSYPYRRAEEAFRNRRPQDLKVQIEFSRTAREAA